MPVVCDSNIILFEKDKQFPKEINSTRLPLWSNPLVSTSKIAIPKNTDYYNHITLTE